MKKLLCNVMAASALLACSTAAFAAADGFFLHAKLGWERSDYGTSNFDYMTSASIHNESVSLSPTLGYQVNPNLAFEASYLDWHTDVDNIALSSNPQGVSGLRNGSIDDYTLDLSVKGMLPLDQVKQGLGIYGKVGAAYVQSIKSGGMNNAALGSDYQNTYAIRPITSVGVSYDINDVTGVDLGTTHLYEGSGIQSADFTYIGLSHHFG